MSLKDSILNEYENGNIVWWNKDGKQVTNIEEFVKLGIDEILVRLNRTEDKLLSIANDDTKVKWVNDYALMKYVKYLYDRLSTYIVNTISLESQIESLKTEAGKYVDNSEEIEKYKEAIESYKNDLRALESELNSVKSQDNDKNEVLHETKQENLNLKEKNVKYAQRIDELAQENEKSKKETQEAIAYMKELKEKFNKIIDEGNSKYNSLQQDFDKLTKNKAELIEKSNEQDDYIKRLQKEKEELETANKEGSKYRIAYENIKKQSDELAEQNKLLKEYSASLESEVETYMANLSKMSTYVQNIVNRQVPAKPKELKRIGDEHVTGYNIGV